MNAPAAPTILLLAAAVAAAVVAMLFFVVVVLILFRWLTARPKTPLPQAPNLGLDVSSLAATPPPISGPALEFYGTPVRLAAYVIAPVGRSGEIRADERLGEMIDHLIPGMTSVIATHRPIIRVWPPQISSQGFTAAFFNKLALPGDRGKGTPWCSAAGKFSSGGRQYLVGVLCCGAEPNGLAQVVVEHDGKWHDVLRTRS